MNEIIKIEKNENNELVTDSRNVADVTSKQHKHVMDIIRKMINDRPEIDGSRFRPIYYIDQYGRKQPCYSINRRGIVTLLFKMTGEQSYKFQDAYMDAFDLMEANLKGMVQTLPDFTDPAEAAIAWAEQYKRAQIEEQKRIEAERTKAHISDKKTATAMATASHLTRENNKLREQVGDSKHYKQVKAIPWLEESFNIKIKAAYSVIGKQLTKISNELQREVREIDHSKYGTVKAYNVDVIDEFRRRVKADAGFLGKYREDNV